MSTFYLIRHGFIDAPPDVLCGRTPGIHLSQQGRAQASRLVDRFRGLSISALYCSPMERALETAAPLAQSFVLPIQVDPEISEIEYGDWTWRTFAELERDPQWHTYNTFRSGARIPQGETALQLQNRVVGFLERVRRQHAHDNIVVVSHGDPIKTAVTYYSGLHLDMLLRFEISHASVTVIKVDDASARVLTLNSAETLPGL
jgi:probable phosphoglycerate mutase